MPRDLVVIGASWGGLAALGTVLEALPADFPAAVAIAQHRSPSFAGSGLADVLGKHCALPIRDAEDKDPIVPGHVYLAPADYHLLVDGEGFGLSIATEMFRRPSIDVLFETAADARGRAVVGVVLTGANTDGARGLVHVRRRGGWGIVQDPATAERPAMPDGAIAAGGAREVLPLGAIGRRLVELCAIEVQAG